MTQYAFFFNQKRCLGCKTCVIACKEWNESKRGDANLNRALTEETAGTFDTPASWGAGARPDTLNGAHSKDILRRFDAKENWRRVTFFESVPRLRTSPLFRYRSAAIIVLNRLVFQFVRLRPFLRKINTAQSELILLSASAAALAALHVPWDAPQYYKDLNADGPRPPMTKATFVMTD